jgi:thymidylate synthase ThyX
MKIKAEVICDSIGEHSPRLTTFLTQYPKFVHAEHCRHRSHSFCVSSSRAIPSKRYLEIVRSDKERAEPASWGSEQKGMSPGAMLEGSAKMWAQKAWRDAALVAAENAERLISFGVHKSIANRILDPFVPVHVLVTSCEAGFLNFFGLRLDRAADPTIRALAEAMWVAWGESMPQVLQPGQWHLPFVDKDEVGLWGSTKAVDQYKEWLPEEKTDELFRRVSTARCARLSYMSFETGRRSTIEEDLALYERLVGAHPIHASPAEHQATPDQRVVDTGLNDNGWDEHWAHPELHGNLPGWIQHRKTLPCESVAPLPEGYDYG